MELKTVGYYKEMPHGRKADNSILDFIDKENSKTTAVYCENYELREECQN